MRRFKSLFRSSSIRSTNTENSATTSPTMTRSASTRVRTPKIKLKRRHRSGLSATFALDAIEDDAENNNDKININSATEEELMTLPGISREVARNIVAHRQKIDGFKLIEDLALVSGVGASCLNRIRSEICTSDKKLSAIQSQVSSIHNFSLAESEQPSPQRRNSRQIVPMKYLYPINVNTSNVFQLMEVKGINQKLAENIVVYREKKGSLKNIDELIKVKGFSQPLFTAVRPFLSLSDDDQPLVAYGSPNLSSRSADVRWGPLSALSVRPPIVSPPSKRAWRVGSWNINTLNREAVENPGVLEVICCTILENRLSVCLLLGPHDEHIFSQICQQLSTPSLENVATVKNAMADFHLKYCHKFVGEFQEFEKRQVRWSVVHRSDISITNVVASHDLTSFVIQCESVQLKVILLRMLPADGHSETTQQLIKDSSELLVILRPGDYSSQLASLPSFSQLLPKSSVEESDPFDVFMMNTSCRKIYTGNNDKIISGLAHPLIPNGWKWGGKLCDTVPRWIEFVKDLNTKFDY